MSQTSRLIAVHVAALAVTMAMSGATARAQSAPNPYYPVDNWAQLPPGIKWGGVISVDADAKGNIWVFHRSEPTILEFDPSGKFVKSLGADLFVNPHGMTLDRDGNIWLTDAGLKDGKGQQVFKLSPEGKVLMTLGKAGVAGETPETFTAPADVAVAPNGDIFVADGHQAKANGRIVKFSKEGKFIKAWGKKGAAAGDMDEPHSLAIDSQGRLFVADRVNSRMEIFDQDGKFLAEWRQFGRPSGVFIDKNDTIYVADSQSNAKQNPGFTRGVRIGSAKTGVVSAFIPDPDPNAEKVNNSGTEGVTADAQGNVFAADPSAETLRKYSKK